MYYGIGIYDLKNCGHLRSYQTWKNVLKKCYKNGYKISDDWRYFSKFKIWYDINYPNHLEEQGINIDFTNESFEKDCKIFSEETCLFLPRFIRMYLTKKKEMTGILKKRNKFSILISDFLTKKQLTKEGFNTKEEAKKIYNIELEKQMTKLFLYLKELNYSDEVIKKIKERK